MSHSFSIINIAVTCGCIQYSALLTKETNYQNAYTRNTIKMIKLLFIGFLCYYICLSGAVSTSVSVSTISDDSASSVSLDRPSGAKFWGYNQARDLWVNGGYPCNNQAAVTNDFWPDVQAIVFPACETQYPYWPGRIQDCKDGAEEYVLERVNECAVFTDCYVLGESAAKGVAAWFCDYYVRYSGETPFFPPNCVDMAKNKCRAHVLDEVNTLIQGNNCGTLTNLLDLTSTDVDVLNEECGSEVDEMADTAELP